MHRSRVCVCACDCACVSVHLCACVCEHACVHVLCVHMCAYVLNMRFALIVEAEVIGAGDHQADKVGPKEGFQLACLCNGVPGAA